MIVKDLIEVLSKLDADKDIHIIYDSYADIPFDIEVADCDWDCGVKKGDYVISAS